MIRFSPSAAVLRMYCVSGTKSEDVPLISTRAAMIHSVHRQPKWLYLLASRNKKEVVEQLPMSLHPN